MPCIVWPFFFLFFFILFFFISLSPTPGDQVPCGRTCSLRGTGTILPRLDMMPCQFGRLFFSEFIEQNISIPKISIQLSFLEFTLINSINGQYDKYHLVKLDNCPHQPLHVSSGRHQYHCIFQLVDVSIIASNSQKSEAGRQTALFCWSTSRKMQARLNKLHFSTG